MANIELNFEIAKRDQVIYNQQEAHRNLWNLLLESGIDEKNILNLATRQGITIEDWTMNSHMVLSPRLAYCGQTPKGYSPCIEQWGTSPSLCREENSNSCLLSHDHSSSACLRLGSSQQWIGGQMSSWFNSHGESFQDFGKSCPEMSRKLSPFPLENSPGKYLLASPFNESLLSASSCYANFLRHHKVLLILVYYLFFFFFLAHLKE